MKIRAEVIKVDGNPNKNNRIYTQEVIENIINSWKQHNMIKYEDDSDFNYRNVCGKVTDAYASGNSIIVEGELYNECFNDCFVAPNTYLTISGYGNVNMNNEIEDYELDHFTIVTECSFDVKPLEIIKE